MSQDMKKPRWHGADSEGLLVGGLESTVPQQSANGERARWHITLNSIRAHLDEQPTRRSRLAAARRWCSAILQMAWEGPQ